MEPQLNGLEYELIGAQGVFATAYLCRIRLLKASIDLMGSFALHGPGGIYSIPTRITGSWKGFPVGCPVAWEKAYAIMGRREKAQLLASWNRLERPGPPCIG